jgi:hypothetical protein
MTVDLATLSRLAEGTLEAPRAAPLRRHLANCAACEEVVEVLARGRRLAAGLPIIAMDDDAREALIDRISTKAVALLPSHETVLRVVDEDHDPGPAISPVIAVIALVLALALGIALAVVSRTGHNTPGPLVASPPPTIPAVVPSFSVSPTAHPHHHRSASVSPSTSATSTTPSSTPPTRPTSATSSTPPSARHPQIDLSPTSGRSGTTISVTGTGWPAGTTVLISYAGQSGGSATVGARGAFRATIVANSLVPGERRIVVRDGSLSATATFDQTL